MKKLAVLAVLLGLGFGVTQYQETLVTPGYTAVFNVNGNISHTFVYKVSNISTNVVLSSLGSLDMANWVAVSTPSTTIVTNGITVEYKATAPFLGMKFRMVSKSGAASTPNVQFTYMGSRY